VRRERGVAMCNGNVVGLAVSGSMVRARCMVRPVADAVIVGMIEIVIDAMVRSMHIGARGGCAGHGRAHRSAQREHEHQQQQQQEP